MDRHVNFELRNKCIHLIQELKKVMSLSFEEIRPRSKSYSLGYGPNDIKLINFVNFEILKILI